MRTHSITDYLNQLQKPFSLRSKQAIVTQSAGNSSKASMDASRFNQQLTLKDPDMS